AGFYPLDVGSDDTTAEFFTEFSKENPNLKVDVMVHAIGFAPRECFDRHILFVDDEAINTAITISANSLQRIMRHAMPYLNTNSSTITLTYAASTRHVPNYGVMSI
ncbi:MAG: SDR family oxidoreductase, partial [Candidatus Thalassarchaeaceae archaeon]|nr:SDR family oxidoreductase [Candidatus Thalassarchaeaceae archaeon]